MLAKPVRTILLTALLLLGSPARTDTPSSAAQAALREAVTQFLMREASRNSGAVTVEIADAAIPRNAKPCDAPQAFLPSGQRAWGHTTVGVRCPQPAWTLFIPARVRVEDDYLVAAHPLAAGSVLGAQDWEVRRGDVAALPPGTLTRPYQAVGRTLRQAVPGGTALRSNQLLVVQAVERGQRVQVISHGPGFQVGNEGIALTAAADGQPVQVRLDSGRVLQGIARSGGRVDVGQ
ncbi:flagellar basal body P-ring formation chaperone FlgA [Niveibacterium sp.]|uniref:flagellar basal body P-ring formation chaperone FlgA n=1 Tax=Niveibacterium sp. TaxID=2017444 RepID=UPI0035B1F62D